MEWDRYQAAAIEDIRDGRDHHTLIKALAGVGKTSVLRASMRVMRPGASVLVGSFGRAIADDHAKFFPDNVVGGAKTFHQVGNEAIIEALGHKPPLDKMKGKRIARSVLKRHGESADAANAAALAKLAGLAKSAHAGSLAEVEAIAIEHGIAGWGAEETSTALEPTVVARLAVECMHASARDLGTIDYDEMIYLPVKLGLRLRDYDYVLCDECLPYKTPVLLADGTSKQIGEIVEKKISASVLAYDVKTGAQRSCKIVGHRKILNQKPLVKVKVRWCVAGSERRRPTNFVVCTTDHRVWANGQWIPAGQLRAGDRVQVETRATKSSAYKLAGKGQEIQTERMRARMQSGRVRRKYPPKGTTAWPASRGGNGTPPPIPETVILSALNAAFSGGWESNYPLGVKDAKRRGLARCYRIDAANAQAKIAVEVDGFLHGRPGRKEADERKDRFLASEGWVVVRVSNDDAVRRTDQCVATVRLAAEQAGRCLDGVHCPIDAIVEAIEPKDLRDYFVYDIEVEDCHNFYANGILVHNCQDLSAAQINMALLSVTPGGRIVMTGDIFQSLYSWRSASYGVADRVMTQLQAREMPLSVTYRCSKAVVRFVNKLVPALEARPGAPEGEVKEVPKASVVADVRPGDFVLSRTNAPLMPLAISLLRKRMPVLILGRDFGGAVLDMMRKAERAGCTTPHAVHRYALDVILAEARAKMSADDAEQAADEAEARGGSLDPTTGLVSPQPMAAPASPAQAAAEERAEKIADTALALATIAEGANSIGGIVHDVQKLFLQCQNDGTPPEDAAKTKVTLATTHACVSPGTIIETSEGLSTIAAVERSGVVATPTGAHRWAEHITRPSGPMLRLTTKEEYTLEVSPDHGMDVWNGETYVRKVASDLKCGEFLRLRLGVTCDPSLPPTLPLSPEADVRATRYNFPRLLDEQTALFLGLMVADGTLYHAGFRLTKRHEDCVQTFARCARDIFGATAKDVAIDQNAFCAEVSSVQIADWLRAVGGMTPHEKTVPRCILRAPLRLQACFLRGLFEDGTVNHRRDGTLDHVAWMNRDAAVVALVRTMLLRFGIITGTTTVTHKKSNSVKTERVYDRLCLYGANAKRFAAHIGFVSKYKNDRLLAPVGPEDRYLVPCSRDEVKELRRLVGSRTSAINNALNRGYFSRAGLARTLTEIDFQLTDGPPKWARERLDWHHSELEQIEEFKGPSMCLDVPKGAQFLQNGFAGWNSKGLERNRVFVLIDTMHPYAIELAGLSPGPSRRVRKLRSRTAADEERNIMYVACTRAVNSLFLVRDGVTTRPTVRRSAAQTAY